MSDKLPIPGQPFMVTVRRRHFIGALRQNSQDCIVALAIKEQFPALCAVRVDDLGCALRLGHHEVAHRWWHDGGTIVRAFDNGTLKRADFPAEGVRMTFTPTYVPPSER